MRLLVIGRNGQLGWELYRSLGALGEVIALDRKALDLAQPARIPGIVRDIRPGIIVNAAAYTEVDRAESEESVATAVNGTAVGVLAAEARRCGALLVHYSTDYVFDGRKDTPYLEDDPPRPINAYGRSKLAGEDAIRDAVCDHLILRTSWVYAPRGRNFLRTILRRAREMDELRIVADQSGAPSFARHIAEATGRILTLASAERAGGSFASGLFHLTNAGSTTWHGFAGAILEEALRLSLLQRRPELIAISTADYPTLAARPRNSRLSGEALKARFGVVLPDWREGIAPCLTEIVSLEREEPSARRG